MLFPLTCLGQVAVNTVSPSISEKVYRTPEVDSKPEVKDGMYTLPLFVSQNFKMPDVHNKKVKIFVGFIVELDGTISNIRFIHQSVNPIDDKLPAPSAEQAEKERILLKTMEAESVRVITAFRKPWNPAVKDGKLVRCQFNYPINFNLE